jgi:hypothetical protein
MLVLQIRKKMRQTRKRESKKERREEDDGGRWQGNRLRHLPALRLRFSLRDISFVLFFCSFTLFFALSSERPQKQLCDGIGGVTFLKI